MVEDDISSLVVVDKDGYLVGIITRTDLVKAIVDHEDWGSHLVREYMADQVVTVEPTTTLMEIARLLLRHHIHRLVVVEEENGKRRPLAVISGSDLVYHMVRDL